MSKERFEQLSKNIKGRKALESVPYCVVSEDRGIEIISGHHRTRAARAAGIKEMPVLIDLNKMTRAEIVAKQLAHNALEGVDNQQILAELYSTISDAELKLASGIDPSIAALELEAVKIPDIEVGFEWHKIALVFLPFQLENFEHVISSLTDEEKILIADLKHWEQFKAALMQVMQKENIKSIGQVVARMSEIVLAKLKEDADKEQQQKQKQQ
jgi:hypothetical protein